MKLIQERIEFIAESLLEVLGTTEEEIGPIGMFNLKSQVLQLETFHARYNEEHGIVEVEMDPTLFEKEKPEDA